MNKVQSMLIFWATFHITLLLLRVFFLGFGLNQTGIIRTKTENHKNIEPKTELNMVGSVSVGPVCLGFFWFDLVFICFGRPYSNAHITELYCHIKQIILLK